MGIFHRHSQGGKRLQWGTGASRNSGVRLPALLLCLSVLAGLFPVPVRAADGGPLLSSIVSFNSIALHYAGSDGQTIGAEVKDNALIRKDDKLILRYTYTISAEQCTQIKADVNYFLDVSPHLALPHLDNGAPLTIAVEGEADKTFGHIYADGSRAWVTFLPNTDNTDTILSDYGGIENADFHLTCNRAGAVPAGVTEEEKKNNLYAIKIENATRLSFGYAEDKPVTAKAQISKGGSLADKTITWTIDYTPWQNPSDSDLSNYQVDLDTPFELRDTIDTSLHSYVDDSVTITAGNSSVTNITYYSPGDPIDRNQEAYVIVDKPLDGGNTTLTFGGTKFNAGQATQGNPAVPLKITYKTSIHDELLLPGGTGGKKITNAADLFAGKGDVFNSLDIKSSSAVTVSQPTWLTKEGKTTRDPGNGSTTDWTVTFKPNGFTFGPDNGLTLHDRLPAGSTLVKDSVKITVGNTEKTGTVTENTADNSFTVSGIETVKQDIIITYQSHVPEDMYDSGTSLGSNIAWFTFRYDGKDYTTPQAKKDVGSGDGSGTPGTATLVKTNTGYNAATRTIDWTVKINPHQAYLKSGTFTDDLSRIGPECRKGHTSGLELPNGVNDVIIKINGKDPADAEKSLINLSYDQQILTVAVGEIGAKTITLTYTTKVCDPCIFANNTSKTAFRNTVSTKNMIIGSQSATERSADSTADVSATVLTKKAPVYDYASGTMKWTIEVDAAGLPMEDVILTDELPAGLTYAENSLTTNPEIPSISSGSNGQTLTINLGTVTQKTTVTFNTNVDPEMLGFGGDESVVVENTIRMNGKADGIEFAEVSHHVRQNFSNHGLVKNSAVNDQQELIRYEVLINPYRLALPENPSLVDTLDKRLQLDTDTLLFYKASLTGTTATGREQKPGYTKEGTGQPLKVTGFDPDANTFTVQLPVGADSRDAYVLTYTADIIDHQSGNYGNSVRFDGGSVLLGGNKNNSASVGGGGGGGGGGVAARKAAISIVKTDSETQVPLPGVSFLLYQWDSGSDERGLPFAQGTTDDQGKLSFKVKPDAVYELVETESIPGYGSEFRWTNLPEGVSETDSGLLITAGAARSELTLHLTNKAHTADIVFRLFNESRIPMAGLKVRIFPFDPAGQPDPTPVGEATVSPDGTVRFPGMRRGAKYYIQHPDGGIMPIDIPVRVNEEPKVILPDGTTAVLNADYQATGTMTADQQWELTVRKVISGGETPLAGAEIGLYADAACRTLIKTGISGQDGTVTFSGLVKGQRYWLKEISAPSGYDTDTAIHEADEVNFSVTSPSAPETPSVDPEEPISPDIPDKPDNPGGPDAPDKPDNPGDPDAPDSPDNPDGPDAPDSPDNPGDPDAPDSPDNPDGPNAPDKPDNPGGPDAPDSPNSRNTSAAASNAPQTGDDPQPLIPATLFSGTLLAAMTLYQFWEVKKRKKK